MKQSKTLTLAMGLLLPLCAAAQEFTPTSFTLMHLAEGSESPTVKPIDSDLVIELSTDRACYAPGERVTFTASAMPTDARVRYRHGAEVIDNVPSAGTVWSWTAPDHDFMGYLVDVYVDNDGVEKILGSIAVDVSSDWTVFPRYGFVADFDTSKLREGVIEAEMSYLNRCHINGVQFQDWHYKHHWPLGGTRDHLLETYTDIANREISTAAVKKYIEVQHGYGMKSIFYNLCFGALKDAAADGVDESLYIYKYDDQGNFVRDRHGLPSDWKSDIFLVNPGSDKWIQYMIERNDDVYHNLDFDGYQIDQLGWRGTVYDQWHREVNLPSGYAAFINAMKQAHPDKRLIMNAVSGYGAAEILGTGKVDLAYTELWGGEDSFADLWRTINTNDRASTTAARTIFAAYMNYQKETGDINTPGVVMTDAVMMALGGAHLELGDHMLCREYFPWKSLDMTAELRKAMIRYYDFSTAYENYLRGSDTRSEITPAVTYTGDNQRLAVAPWPPQQGKVVSYGRTVDGVDVYHLLNFVNIDNLSWRDLDGTRQAPEEFSMLPISLATDRQIDKVWVASPDYHGGVPQELAFTVSDGKVDFTLPALKYWTMIVVE